MVLHCLAGHAYAIILHRKLRLRSRLACIGICLNANGPVTGWQPKVLFHFHFPLAVLGSQGRLLGSPDPLWKLDMDYKRLTERRFPVVSILARSSCESQ